jgi:hypothetical protein
MNKAEKCQFGLTNTEFYNDAEKQEQKDFMNFIEDCTRKKETVQPTGWASIKRFFKEDI